MLILAKGKLKDPDLGFATTFLTQMEQVLGTCLAEGIVVVSNAGGLNPAGCAEALSALAARLGLVAQGGLRARRRSAAVAWTSWPKRASTCANLDTGESLADLGASPLTANAYLGAWGIRQALDHDADVVITGRVTDAAAGGRAGRVALRVGAHGLGSPGRRGGRRPRARVRRPVHRRQLRLLRRGPGSGAAGLPPSRDPPGRILRGDQASRDGGSGLGRHRHRPAPLRDPGRRLLQPRRGGGLRLDPPDRRRARPGPRLGREGPTGAPTPPRWRSTTWAATATR